MIRHTDISDKHLHSLIRTKALRIGGNARLRIYGLLRCASGMRMNKFNRVFFEDEEEAIKAGFRRCGHCMNAAYRLWKKEQTK